MYQRLTKRALVQFDLEPGDKDFNDFMIRFSYYEKAQLDIDSFLEEVKTKNKEEVEINQQQIASGFHKLVKQLKIPF